MVASCFKKFMTMTPGKCLCGQGVSFLQWFYYLLNNLKSAKIFFKTFLLSYNLCEGEIKVVAVDFLFYSFQQHCCHDHQLDVGKLNTLQIEIGGKTI